MNPTDTLGRDGKRPSLPTVFTSAGQYHATGHTVATEGPGHPAGGRKPGRLTVLRRRWQLWRADRQWHRRQATRIAEAWGDVATCQETYEALLSGTCLAEERYPDLACYGSQEIAVERAWQALLDAQRHLADLEAEARTDVLLRGVGAR